MTIEKITFQKGKGEKIVKIGFSFLICDCGARAIYKGYAGCSHDADTAYFYQCPSCKDIEIHDTRVMKAGEGFDELISMGWYPE